MPWEANHLNSHKDLELETTRMTLRPMTADDMDGLLGIFGDARVMAAFNERPFNHQQMERWLARNLEHQTEHGYGLFACIRKEDGHLIGNCGLEHMMVDGRQETELGYDFRSTVWNQGYATEAATAVRDFAFADLRLPRLISLIRVGNGASRRVAEKIGMHLEATIEPRGTPYWRYRLDSGTPADGR